MAPLEDGMIPALHAALGYASHSAGQPVVGVVKPAQGPSTDGPRRAGDVIATKLGGFLWRMPVQTDSESRDAERTDRAKREAWETLGIPCRYWPAFLGAAPTDETPALEAARALVASADRLPSQRQVFLVLAGGKGTGKSFAAAWACAQRAGLYVRAIELARHGNYGQDAAWWRDLERRKFLALDDLGREPLDAGGYVAANLGALLDARYSNALQTVVTTNLSASAFAARYLRGDGELLQDRLHECGRWVSVTGESRRKPVASQKAVDCEP